MNNPPRPAIRDILLIEDNPVDVLMCKTAFDEAGIDAAVHVIQNGDEASKFLHHEGKYAEAPTPNLVLLDLNLPGKSGYELLEELKQSEALRQIPVIVLTSSAAESDIAIAYNLNAKCFLTKPLGYSELKGMIEHVIEYWFSLAKLPENKLNSL